MQLFNKKVPAWLLMAALVIVGAGAATGLVLKDQIDGTTTIAVSQALTIVSVDEGIGSDADEFLATIHDDGTSWAAHFEANNGDVLELEVTVDNLGGSDDIVALLTMDVPEGITVNVEGDSTTTENVVQIAPNQWKFVVLYDETNTLDITLAIEDAATAGFYEIASTIIPVNV